MKTFHINELGCKVNQYESQLMREQLKAIGLTEAIKSPADLYIINTCTVTASADSGSRNFIRRALRDNPQAKIIAAGCYVEKNSEDIKKICKNIILLKNNQKDKLMSYIDVGAGLVPALYARATTMVAPTGISGFSQHNRAFVKIQDGCDNHCSYCKVPLVRGRSVSRGMNAVLREAGRLAESGFKEIVLCGICLGAYKDLITLLDGLENIKDFKRIRLSSIEPAYVNSALIKKIASSHKICRHLHIPLQSGDDKILKLMNRKYTAREYLNIICDVRKAIPEIAVSTDVLIGFPGESEKEFENTLETLTAVNPMRVHVFGFSKREATPAFFMKNTVSKKDITERVRIVNRLAGKSSQDYKSKFLNKNVEVLVEDSRDKKTNLLGGYTDTYIRVLFDGPDNLKNKLVSVKIKEIASDCAIGRME